jgi:glycosyltransferase involved in cell wall biosynthesis
VRVILLTHHYPRWPGDFSGAALGTLTRALVRRGVSVRVLVPSDEPTGRAALDGVDIHRVRVARRLAETLRDQDALGAWLRKPLAWARLARVWQSLRAAAHLELASGADVMHAHWCFPWGLAAPRGVPLVLTVHGADVALVQRSRLARSLTRRLWRRTSLVTAVSHQVGESVQTLAGRFVPPDYIQPMPIETRGLSWTRGGGGAVVLGRLDPQGRVELALETIAVLASAGNAMPLTVIGDGPSRHALQRRAEQLGVSASVRFLGAMPLDQARSHLARADFLLFTRAADTSTATVLEALITGVPVVACWDSGEPVSIVPQSGAGRLSLPSADALADSVTHLLADRDRLAVTRLVGEAWRGRLAPDYVAERCESWYRHALAK